MSLKLFHGNVLYAGDVRHTDRSFWVITPKIVCCIVRDDEWSTVILKWVLQSFKVLQDLKKNKIK